MTQRITGYFPVEVVPGSASAYSWQIPTDTGPYRPAWSMLEEEFLPLATPTVNAAIARDSSIFWPIERPVPNEHFGPFNCTFEGDLPVPTPDKFIELYERIKVSNGDRWRKRHRTHDIIMSPVTRGSVHISYSQGYTEKAVGHTITRRHYFNPGPFKSGPLPGTILLAGKVIYDTSAFVAYQWRDVEVVANPYALGWSDEKYISSLKERIDSSPYDPGMIMGCLAEANRGTIDALTALAEMPETVRSIYDGAKFCLRMYSEARKKEIRLYNKAKGKSNSATAKKNAQELADAIADVWLNFRYNITPNVMMIEDLINTLETDLVEFIRFRDTMRKPMENWNIMDSSWEYSNSLEATERVLIKRLIDLRVEMPKIKHLVLSNVVVTGYELIPFSFVADWFVNLGDTLAGLFVNPDFRLEGSTYSWKIRGTETYIHKATKATVVCEVKAYRRIVINPREAGCLTFKVDLNWKRQLDALALGWSLFKGNFKKNYN